MNREKYLAAVNKWKPHLFNWGERIHTLSAEEKTRIMAEYERAKQEHIAKSGDECMANFWAKTKVGHNHEFMVEDEELNVFRQKNNWLIPWSDLSKRERNAFFKLLLSQVFSYHDHSPCNAPMPDFRPLLIGFIENDAKFLTGCTGYARKGSEGRP